MNKNAKNTFNYTYSAQEQEEVKKILKKYIPQEEDKMHRLRRLDANVYKKATVQALIIGILGALILGIGMCCCMVWMGFWFIPGIMVGIVGILLICIAYPVYHHTLKKEREKIAPEIIRLTDELMK